MKRLPFFEHPLEQHFPGVQPRQGWLGRAWQSAANPRRWRWNVYLRACRAIPSHSPVAGSTSWERINDRRGALLERKHSAEGLDAAQQEELTALQNVCGALRCGLTAGNLILARVVRRMKGKAKGGRPKAKK